MRRALFYNYLNGGYIVISVFLIGGGWQNQEETIGRFVKAITVNKKRKIALILLNDSDANSEEVATKYLDAFSALGVTQKEMEIVWISQDKPLLIGSLEQISPTGIFIGGGTTPLYQDILCQNSNWVEYILKRNLPYCGFSAGAAIAAEKALIGGWKLQVGNQAIPVVDEECSEDLEWLTVKKGLKLVPFSVDVHASQWGNLSRIIHGVEQQLLTTGWAIDENTLMQVDGRKIQVWGSGQVYRIERKREGQIQLDILRAGEQYYLAD